MDRVSSKHGPRLDDELARETESIVRGAPIEPRVEEEREKEGPARTIGTSTPAQVPLPASAPTRSRHAASFSRHLRPTVFPADRDRLVVEAERNAAPAPVVEALRGLPAGTEFRTAHEVWIGLTEPEAARERGTIRERASAEPLSDAER